MALFRPEFAPPLALRCALVLAASAAACTTEVQKVETVCKSGTMCTYAGVGRSGFNGDGLDRRDSLLSLPVDIAFGCDGRMAIIDFNNYRVRIVQADETLKTVVGDGFPGDGDPAQADKTAAGAEATQVRLNHPSDLFFPAMDTALANQCDGVLTAWHNHRVRVWDPVAHRVYAHCGSNPGYGGDGKVVTPATQFNQPSKAVQDGDGNTYLIDSRNWVIRKIAKDGTISTIAGQKPKTPAQQWSGFDLASDTAPVPLAGSPFLFFDLIEFSNPVVPGGGLALSPDNTTLYVADTGNHRIRAIDLKAGTVKTIAGSGPSGCTDDKGAAVQCQQDTTYATKGSFAGDGGPALQARLNGPHDLAWGPDGRLYFADTGNNRIRAINLVTGVIDTVAGSGQGDFGDTDVGDGKPALQARLAGPSGIAFDKAGNLYIADMFHSRIRVVPK